MKISALAVPKLPVVADIDFFLRPGVGRTGLVASFTEYGYKYFGTGEKIERVPPVGRKILAR